MSSLSSIFTEEGLRTVNKTYRERLGGPPFPIEVLKPIWKCQNDGCTRIWNPNTNEGGGVCTGFCCY